MTATTASIVVEHKRILPPIADTDHGPVAQVDVAATVRCGTIHAEIQRFAYWHANDGLPMDVTFEVRRNGLPEHGGTCDVYADEPEVLVQLAQVAMVSARLLAEYKLDAAGL